MNPRIVFFDLEGTLIRIPSYSANHRVAASAWTVLAAKLGRKCLDEEEASKLRWEAGGFRSYLDWMDFSIEVLVRHGLTQSIFFEVIDGLKETPGIREASRQLQDLGAKLAIVTGGFKQVADRAQIAIRAEHSMSACELFFDDVTGRVCHWNLLPSDYFGKVDFMRLLIREYGVDPSDCVFVGDGPNDVLLAKEVGLSIAFNAAELLQRKATYAISQPAGREDFLAVSELIKRH